jgi:predicted Na+-dependent transporter
MTEGLYQILHLNFKQAIKANIFSPIIIPLLLYFIIKGEVPRMNNRSMEAIFFSVFITLSIFVNIYN